MRSDETDTLVQRHISTARIGKEIFTIWHRDYSHTFYDIMMGMGRALEPSNHRGLNAPSHTPKPFEAEF
jgi:hypothetical protein